MRHICKSIACLALSMVLITPITANARPSPSAIVIDAKTGEVLSSKNPNTVHYPASLTKLMTLYITFEALEKGMLSMDDELLVSRTAANRSPSRLGVKPGEKITVRTAIDALIIKSANDCATVLAEGLGYTEAQFAEKMTEVAKALGMKNTVFKNASGLPNRKQVTTARDMATLAAAVYFHFPQYYDLFSQTKFSYNGRTYYTHNHILKNFEGADGMKTGFIAAAGFNIVTSAQRDRERVIAVAMGYNTQDERDRAVSQMMEQGFKKLALNNTREATTSYVKFDSSDFSIERLKEQEQEKAPQVADSNIDPDAVWSVQVGAFSNYAKARVYAQKIRRQYKGLNSHNVKVEPAESNFSIVYRSKLVGLKENDAKQICNDLQKKNKSCIVAAMNEDKQQIVAEN